MNFKYHTENWLFYGISDLYFSFNLDKWVFDYYSTFFTIMALEKHLKAFLIFKRQDEYKSLNDKDMEAKTLSIARGYGHKFKKMVDDANSYIMEDKLQKILEQNYDGYKGEELLEVFGAAYMETRYPTAESVSEKFPLDEPDTYHNPLSSSGLHKMVRASCELLASETSSDIDLKNVLENVGNKFEHIESFSRFKNLYLATKWN